MKIWDLLNFPNFLVLIRSATRIYHVYYHGDISILLLIITIPFTLVVKGKFGETSKSQNIMTKIVVFNVRFLIWLFKLSSITLPLVMILINVVSSVLSLYCATAGVALVEEQSYIAHFPPSIVNWKHRLISE